MPHFHTNSPTVAGSVLLCSNTHSLFGNLGQMCLCSKRSPLLWMPPVLWQPSSALTPRSPPQPGGGLWTLADTLGVTFWCGRVAGTLCLPGRMGASSSHPPVEYFAPFALLDWAPITSKTWRALWGALFTSVLRTSWKSISFVPSVNIANEGSDADRSQEEETCLQLRQTQPCWAAVGPRKIKFALVIQPTPEKNVFNEYFILTYGELFWSASSIRFSFLLAFLHLFFSRRRLCK